MDYLWNEVRYDLDYGECCLGYGDLGILNYELDNVIVYVLDCVVEF